MARLAIFIDGGYLDKLGQYDFGGASLDFAKLSPAIVDVVAAKTPEPVDLLRTLYYHCPPYQSQPPTAEESQRTARFRGFANALKYLKRFDFREGRLALRGFDRETGEPIFQQKRVDLLLGLDFALLAGKGRVSHVALLTGDSDLIPAVQVAKQESVATWLFHGSQYSQELWQEVDERCRFDQTFIDLVRR